MKSFEMRNPIPKSLVQATRLVGAGKLAEATLFIRNALQGRVTSPLPIAPTADVSIPAGSTDDGPDLSRRFLKGRFVGPAGSRPYRLYIPHGYHGQPVPLIVMLHGCTQSPEDFALGTRMNEIAEAQNFLVLYPGQTRAANASKCWNWFNVEDQQADRGEPLLLAGMTRQIMAEYAIDPKRVFVAGLSAGGAAALIMGATYSGLYAAVGVHSGLAYAAASDASSAFFLMRQGGKGPSLALERAFPTIVFQGDADTTVNPANADAIIDQLAAGLSLDVRKSVTEANGRRGYERAVYSDRSGKSLIEKWIVHGAGHAWSGGSPAGSFTDPAGPDASEEMLKFFLSHPRH